MGDSFGAVVPKCSKVRCSALFEIENYDDTSSSLVTHETSYLPFVFSCINTSGSSPQPVKLRGRRTWNKRGQEVTEVDVRPCI